MIVETILSDLFLVVVDGSLLLVPVVDFQTDTRTADPPIVCVGERLARELEKVEKVTKVEPVIGTFTPSPLIKTRDGIM